MARILVAVLAGGMLQSNGDAPTRKAPDVLYRVQQAWAKKKGCHVEFDVTSTLLSAELRALEKAEFKGKLIRDFMGVNGSAEIYGRGAEKLVRQDKQFVEPRRASGRLNRTGTLARNPAVIAAELFRFRQGAAFGADEKLEGVECRVLETSADEKSVMEQVKEITGNLKSLENYFIKDLSSVADRKNSKSVYKAWIARETMLPVKIEWTLTIAVNKKAIPMGGEQLPDAWEAAYVYKLSKYDTELQLDVPPPVRAKFGAP